MEMIKIYDIAHITYILKNKGYLLEYLVSLRIFNIYENFPKRLKKNKGSLLARLVQIEPSKWKFCH